MHYFIILISLVLLTKIFLVWFDRYSGTSDLISFSIFAPILVFSLMILFHLVAPGISYLDGKSNIDRYMATKKLLEVCDRKNSLPCASLVIPVAEINTSIQRAKRWDSSPWLDYYQLDEFANLEPLRFSND